LAHFGLPWVRPWDNRGKCHMDGKSWSNASKHVPLAFNATVGVIPLDDLRDFGGRVAGWPGYNMVQKYPRKIKPPEWGARVRHRRQTDGFEIALAKRNVVKFG